MDEVAATEPKLALDPFTRNFLASLCAHFSAFLYLHLTGFLAERGASEAYIGDTAAVTALTAIAVRPFVGPLMDRHGRRAALIGGGLVHVVAASLYLVLEGPGVAVFAFRALHGVAFGMFFSAVFTVAADLAPPAIRTQRMAIFGISGILPMALGAIAGTFLVRHFDYVGVFATGTLFAALGLAFALTVPETRPEGSGSGPGFAVLEALREPQLVPLWVAGAVFSAAIASYFIFVRNYVVGEHIGTVDHFFTPYAVVAILARLRFGTLPSTFGELRMFPAALLVLTAGLVMLSVAGSSGLVVLAGGLCGFGHAFAFPSLLSLFVSRSDERIRATVVSLFTALMDVGVLGSGRLYGMLADARGFAAVFAVAAVLSTLTSVGFFLATRPREA